MQIILVDNLNFSYFRKSKNIENNFLLKSISFEVDKGNVFSILGPNGSGKSTLLKLLAKIYTNCRGSIKVYGKEIEKYDFKKYSKIVHFIMQNPLLNMDFTVIDTIVTGVNPKLKFFEFPSKEDYEKAEEILAEFNLLHLKEKTLKQISGGENQLVFFLRALMSNADILIFDEPTAFLDFRNQFKILEIIKKISLKNKTIILSLHDPNHVIKISDKVMLLKNGESFKIGKPDEILNEENLSYLYDVPVKCVNGNSDLYFYKI